MPLDPEGEELFPQGQRGESRYFSPESVDAVEARLAQAQKRSVRWQHGAQRKRDRNRFFVLLFLLIVVLCLLWKQWGPYLARGGTGAH